MAHFAQIDENNLVINVIVVRDEDCNGGDDEVAGQEFIASIGLEGTWKRCSINTQFGKHLQGKEPFRGHFAGYGSIYDPELDIFMPRKPTAIPDANGVLPTYVFNKEKYEWEVSTEAPTA